jgi:hypothetical protein
VRQQREEMPKALVARGIDRSALVSKQTAYMPRHTVAVGCEVIYASPRV